MIHWNKENQKLKNGLSVYPFNDNYSAGFCLRIGSRMLQVRYAKFTKKWIFKYHKTDRKKYEHFMKGP